MSIMKNDDSLYLLTSILSRNGSGNTALVIAKRLLEYYGSIQGLAFASQEELRTVGPLTEKQAEILYLMLQLGQQVCSSPLRAGECFCGSRELYLRYRARFFASVREYFFAFHLNARNQLIREVLVSIGSLSTSVVHPREVFSSAVRDSSASLILLHNHPSGDPSPSSEDHECTRRLQRAGRILGIRVLDHIVMGHNDYFSFADAGQLEE